jgi:hypothetical protein
MEKLQTAEVQWANEDELPEMSNDDFYMIFKASQVWGVRIYPYIEDSEGNRIWITKL